MVVYRKEINNLDPSTGTTAAQSVEDSSNDSAKTTTNVSHMVPRAILTSRPNSHAFQERHLVLDQPIKVGRSVARCRPAPSNAIFDCKVLSRNHALLWYENGKFYLQDTKSSNGTFVNNQRLSKGSEESPAREVCSGDIVQFGVDVVENCRKVVHGCIVATLKLYLPDGKEAKASPTTAVVPLSTETSVSSQELYQLSQYLQEALHREQVLENKLGTLQKVVANTQDESDIGWKALIEEDRLLSRIETLESQLQTCGKNITEEKLKEDVLKLQEDKDKYQNAAKESLKKVLQEKLEVLGKVQALENSLSNTENECSHLEEVAKQKERELELLLQKSCDSEKEVSELSRRLAEAEDLLSQSHEDKLLLENSAQEQRREEQLLSTRIEALKAENDFANEQLTAMKAHFDILKKDPKGEDNNEKNGNVSPDDLEKTENGVDCLALQKVHKENLKNEEFNGDTKPADYVNKLQADIQQLKRLLAESRDDKKLVDGEVLRLQGQLEEARKAADELREELAGHDSEPPLKEEETFIAEDSLHKKCYEEKIKALEADLIKCLVENTKLENQHKTLQDTCAHLQACKLALENKDDAYWKEHVVVRRERVDETSRQLSSAQEEIALIRERYERCNSERSYLEEELDKFKEQLRLLSTQSKTISVCSFVPLLVLAVAVVLAFYPTLAHFTATSDQA